MKSKSGEATWGGERKGAGRKPLGERKRVHRSVTIDPDIYQRLSSETGILQSQGFKVKISDVLNCRLRRDYKHKSGNLIPEDLEWARQEKQQALKRRSRRIPQ